MSTSRTLVCLYAQNIVPAELMEVDLRTVYFRRSNPLRAAKLQYRTQCFAFVFVLSTLALQACSSLKQCLFAKEKRP